MSRPCHVYPPSLSCHIDSETVGTLANSVPTVQIFDSRGWILTRRCVTYSLLAIHPRSIPSLELQRWRNAWSASPLWRSLSTIKYPEAILVPRRTSAALQDRPRQPCPPLSHGSDSAAVATFANPLPTKRSRSYDAESIACAGSCSGVASLISLDAGTGALTLHIRIPTPEQSNAPLNSNQTARIARLFGITKGSCRSPSPEVGVGASHRSDKLTVCTSGAPDDQRDSLALASHLIKGMIFGRKLAKPSWEISAEKWATTLRTVFFDSTDYMITANGHASMARLTSLQHIRFGSFREIPFIDDQFLATVRPLQNLISFSAVGWTGLTVEALRHVANHLSRLRSLDLTFQPPTEPPAMGAQYSGHTLDTLIVNATTDGPWFENEDVEACAYPGALAQQSKVGVLPNGALGEGGGISSAGLPTVYPSSIRCVPEQAIHRSNVDQEYTGTYRPLCRRKHVHFPELGTTVAKHVDAGLLSGFSANRPQMPALELEEFWDDNNDAIKYSAGNWSLQYGGIYHGSAVMRTKQIGDSMSVAFQGSSIRFIGAQGGDHSSFLVNLDGAETVVNGYCCGPNAGVPQVIQFEATGLAKGEHVLNLKNWEAGPNGSVFEVDGLLITPHPKESDSGWGWVGFFVFLIIVLSVAAGKQPPRVKDAPSSDVLPLVSPPAQQRSAVRAADATDEETRPLVSPESSSESHPSPATSGVSSSQP
ncbi:hypothetical protein B0H13DRAFT_1880782 [Mycena leptocephala]|nr:hypothetical protein B0H13DRAFT_1880782 [Mycena leptocephala]